MKVKKSISDEAGDLRDEVREVAHEVGEEVREAAHEVGEEVREAGRTVGRQLEKLREGLILASEGSGPLLQRDYWGVIDRCRLAPPEVAELVAKDFCSLAPEELVRFVRCDAQEGPLEVGDELDVAIRVAGRCRVRVLHRDGNSLTLGTLEGHPEAGRITFGAYRNDEGDVIFHIRSRARASSSLKYAGFLAAGEPMQTTTWTDFVDRVAHISGDGIVGVIHAETIEIEDEPDDLETVCSPTFLAVGD
jgi:hypothetical protein